MKFGAHALKCKHEKKRHPGRHWAFAHSHTQTSPRVESVHFVRFQVKSNTESGIHPHRFSSRAYGDDDDDDRSAAWLPWRNLFSSHGQSVQTNRPQRVDGRWQESSRPRARRFESAGVTNFPFLASCGVHQAKEWINKAWSRRVWVMLCGSGEQDSSRKRCFRSGLKRSGLVGQSIDG